MKTIHIIGGGTVSHVRAHLALCAPAYGASAKALSEHFEREIQEQSLGEQFQVKLHLTRMAGGAANLESNEDVERLLDTLIAEPSTRCIVMNAALCDFSGQIGDQASGKGAARMESRQGEARMDLTPTPKILGKIRAQRKDIFAIGFKTTSNASEAELYTKALRLLKQNSLNLVFANDIGNKANFIVAPEETRYAQELGREGALAFLARQALSRMRNHFTRSTVIEGPRADWNGEMVPENLREVVNHCIKQGAYKPVLGKTAGHFAARMPDGRMVTSLRKSDFNALEQNGMVLITPQGSDTVIAQGGKPSVGGQSQRIIFKQHPELDCIVHFHCPPKPAARAALSVKAQWPNECGSHECGQNTSEGLREIDLGAGDRIKAVYLDEHGPNIVFSKSTPASKVIAFIDAHFDLAAKTGGIPLGAN